MSDTKSASIFGIIFRYLAENPDDRAKRLAFTLYNHISNYDFSGSQMDADEACILLGIAKRGSDEAVLWLDDEGYDET